MYSLKLEAKETVALDTTLFALTKPKDFTFVAGQYMDVTIPSSSGDKLKHTFSITSGPADNKLEFATRIRKDSQFKQQLRMLEIGSMVEIEGPFGDFVLPEDKDTPIVFIAAGIGITPIRSIGRSLAHNHDYSLSLFYANRNRATTPFYQEVRGGFDGVIKDLTMTMSNPSTDWDGETTKLSADFILSLSTEPESVFYVVGTQPFVEDICSQLRESGVKAERIKQDMFWGYEK